jgi:hypothetical protein
MAGGQLLLVEGKGFVSLSTTGEININDRYFVPGLIYNFILVGCLADNGFVLVFDNQQCLVFKARINDIIGKGFRDSTTSLYRYILAVGISYLCCTIT